jgi:hypothetical protein
MPSWKQHKKQALELGIPTSLAYKVNCFLDFPEVGHWPLAHKALHNPIGIYLVKKKFGDKAAEYARMHIEADFREEFIRSLTKKLLKSTKHR